MGSTFFEFIKRTGIFLISAEAILHFAPGSSYQKYIKVLIGIMVLAQFIIPLKAIISGQERAVIEQQIEGFAQAIEGRSEEMQLNGLWLNDDESIKNATINEIRLRINNIATDRGYVIMAIDIDDMIRITVGRAGSEMEAYGYVNNTGTDNTGTDNTGTDNTGTDNSGSGTEAPVVIPKIEFGGLDDGVPIEGNSTDEQKTNVLGQGNTDDEEGNNEELKGLREQFCNELGTDERYLEVIEHG